MAVTEIIFYLNLGTAVFAALAVVCAIAATVITFLYRPFRQEEPPVMAPAEPMAVKRKHVVTRIDPSDIQTMKRLFETPKTDPGGWLGTTEGKEAEL